MRGEFGAELTSVIGSLNSARSIDPVRHRQYLIGAGLGSANNRASARADIGAPG
jgi:hypothetical protein